MEAESVKGICRVNRLGAVGASPVAQMGKKSPAIRETWV